MKNKKVMIMGYSLDALTMDETIAEIENCIKSRTKCQHAVLNAAKVVIAEKDETLKSILNECEIVNADGQSIVWASKFLKKPLPERVAGIDLMERLLEISNIKGYRVYFFGATEEVVTKTVEEFRKKYPGLIVAGYRNGYFAQEVNSQILEQMRAAKPDILFVGFSSPMKEYWLKENMAKLDIPVCMGVGGSFDVAAGLRKRAPIWMQRRGLEWLYRFIQEPERMWRRYLVGNMKFVFLVIKYKFIDLWKIVTGN